MSKSWELLLKGVIGLTFFVPLLVMPGSFIFPFIVPKVIVFRTLVLLLIGLYLPLLISDWQRYRPRATPLTVAIGLFWVSLIISTFAGVDWYRSFWDNHERMLGLFTITHYLLYYLVITSIVKTWPEWRMLLRLFLVAGMLVMAVGFAQKLNPDLLLNQGSNRVISTLGNPIYYGGYAVFLLFTAVLLFWKEEARAWRIIALGEAGAAFFGIFFSGTRGSFLGLAAGIGVVVFSYLLSLRGAEHRRVRSILAGLIVLGVVTGGTAWAFRATPLVKQIPLVGDIVNVSISAGSASTRIMAWQIALKAWQDKPIFGWGPNNFYHAFNQYYRPEFLEHGYGETWFDNAHNIIINTLAVQGVVGVVVYLGLFFVAIGALWQAYQRGVVDAHILSIASGFLVAHLVQNVFVFENPTSYLFFFFFLAFVNAMSQGEVPLASAQKTRRISGGVATMVGLVILLLIYSTNVNSSRANTATLEVIRALGQGRPALELYTQALAIPSPHIDDIRNDLARAVSQVIPQYEEAKRTREAVELFDLAYDGLEKNQQLHPFDVRVYMQQSQLAQQGAALKKDTDLLTKAEVLLEQALQLSPKRQQIQFLLAAMKTRVGKYTEAVSLLQSAIQNDPKVDESWWRLALLYREVGQKDKAKELIGEAEKQGVHFSSEGERVVQEILAE